MKNNLPTIVWLPLAFIAGGLVGYYGPAEELRNSERRIEEVKAETKSKSPKRNDELAFGTFTQMMKIPDAANKHKRRPTANPIAKNEVGSANTNPPVAKCSQRLPLPCPPPVRQLAPQNIQGLQWR